jgi:adenosylcobinamide-GDP ribazoletransferase
VTSRLAPLRLAFAFLTRIPLPIGSVTPWQLGAAVAYFPLVGAVLGAAQLLALALLPASLEPVLIGVALVAVGALLTGALHLDGLADVFDGLGGGRGDSQRMLEIMRDPRIGAHGATALVLVLLGKVYASGSLAAHGVAAGLFIAPVCARLSAAVLIRSFPYARSEGSGRSFRDHATWNHVAIAGVTTALAVAAAGWEYLAPALVGLVLAGVIGLWVRWRAGGLTGDAYGAAIEICELGVLVAARWSW